MKKFVISSFGAMLLFQVAVAQQQKIVADKIVAKVGEKIILQSDIESALVDMQQQALEGQPLPPNAQCAAIEQIIAQKILVLQAERDSCPSPNPTWKAVSSPRSAGPNSVTMVAKT